jgi:hypothetical protein
LIRKSGFNASSGAGGGPESGPDRPIRQTGDPSALICITFTQFLYRHPRFSPPFLQANSHTASITLIQEDVMDMVMVGGIALVWGLMVLLVRGFEKLEQPKGGRP